MLLANQNAIVTGAGKGIGKAIAKKLAEEGASVFLVGRNEQNLEAVRNEILSDGGAASCCLADVSKEQDVLGMLHQFQKLNARADILVNNAGVSKEMPLSEMPMAVWDEIINVNLRSVALVIKAFLPLMTGQKSGNIVNIGSGAALRGLPGSTAYSAAKAGVVALTQSLGDELRPLGIRVNAVCPGPVDTEMFQKSEKRDFILKAGGDVFAPETIANGVLYLCSNLSRGVSSQTLTIRGINRW